MLSLRIIRLALPGALAALPALACPQDLGSGVVVRFEDGSTAIYSPTDRPGVMRERMTFDDDDDGFEVLSWYGIYPLEEVDVDADGALSGSGERSDYAAPPPSPRPDQRVAGIVAQVVSDAVGSFQRRLDLITGPMTELEIGPCRYPAFPAELTLGTGRDENRVRFMVLPGLGVAVVVGYEERAGAGRFVPVAITAQGPGG
jgi:hypothetical protein